VSNAEHSKAALRALYTLTVLMMTVIIAVIQAGNCNSDLVSGDQRPGDKNAGSRVCLLPDKNPVFVVAMAFVGHHVPGAIIVISYAVVYYEIRNLIKTRPQDKQAKTSGRRIDVAQQSTVTDTDTVTDAQPESSITVVQSADTEQNRQSPTYKTGEKNDAGSHPAAEARRVAWGNVEDGKKTEGCKPGSTKADGVGKSPELVQSTRRPEEETSKGKKKSDGKRPSNSRRKAFITLSYIVLAYVVCWFPFQFVFDVSLARPELISADLYTAMFWLAYINSGLNPFMYAFSSADFRTAVVQIVKCRFCWP